MEFLKKNFLNILLGLLALAISSVVVILFLSIDAENTVAELRNTNARSLTVGHKLRQTSVDLTRMARNYIETGDETYKKYYYDILSMRDGKSPRPKRYENAYWDLVMGGKLTHNPQGETISLRDMFLKENFTKQELAKFDEAEANSNALALIEIQAMNTLEGKFKDANGKYTIIGEPNPQLASQLLYNAEYNAAVGNIMQPIDEFLQMAFKRTSAELKQAEDYASAIEVAAGVSLILSGILLVLVYFVGRKNIQAELQSRLDAQQKAEAENEKLNNSVISILQTMQALSQRDLTAKAPVTDDIIGTVSDSVNALTDETSKVLLGVTSIANQVETGSFKVKQQAALVSETAENERQSVHQMTTALTKATQLMNQMAHMADSSNQSASKATQATDNALQTVNTTVQGMDSIRETIAQTEKRIKRLGERSQEISGIVNLINTISERTHVLALNASMQAAVAGEAGRGFAVVAEEVQRLAESSRNATEQIETLVKNIQVDTNETINTVNETISQVVEGSKQAQQAGLQMQETQQITAQLVAQVQKIAQAAEVQQKMSNKLMQSVEQIGQSTEKTAKQIEEQNKETQHLEESAKQLVDSVRVFKLPQAS